jgi:glycosyltransferase involved in cell wall biosynthesis
MTALLRPQRVLYVVSLFPALSETFIVREIEALIARGVDVRILSLKSSRETMVQPQAAALLDRVLHPAHRSRTVLTACGVALRRPVLTLRFLATMVSELWRQPGTFAKSLVAVVRALGRIAEIRAFDPQLLHAPWATYPATVAWFLSRLLDRPFSFTSRAHDIFVEDHMMARKLLSVGRLVPMKGFDILLLALAELRARGVDFTCTVIGEGPERARLEGLRTALGLESAVEFPGAMPQEAVVRHMSEATLMVLPCVVTADGQSDGIPNVLMESMAAGLPVVSTRVSGIPELVEDGVNGRLVAPGDPIALANAVRGLLLNPRQCEFFAEAGRRKVERDFNVRIEAGRLLEHFGTSCHA